MILLVDDNDPAVQALIRMLGSSHLEAARASLGDAASKPRRLSLVLADLKVLRAENDGLTNPVQGTAGDQPLAASAPPEADRDHAILDRFIRQQLEAGSQDLYEATLDRVEKFLLKLVLQHTRGNQSRAAEILGITRGSLRYKLRHRGVITNPSLSAGFPGFS